MRHMGLAMTGSSPWPETFKEMAAPREDQHNHAARTLFSPLCNFVLMVSAMSEG